MNTVAVFDFQYYMLQENVLVHLNDQQKFDDVRAGNLLDEFPGLRDSFQKQVARDKNQK